MAEAYHTIDRNPSPDRPECRGVSRSKVIEAAKQAVPTIDLADRLRGPGGWRKVGNRWVCRCPLPDHDERTPSFTVYPETNSWFCYGCLRGGDVVELARYAWGYEKSEAPMAAANVLEEFGLNHEIPSRPTSWFTKQRREQKIREGLDEIRARTVQRRLFRIFEPYLSPIKDPDMRLEEANTIFSELYPIACMVVAQMEDRGT